MGDFLEKHKDLLEKAVKSYYSNEETTKWFGYVPLSRYHTFKYCYENINNKNNPFILELEPVGVLLMEDLKDVMKMISNIGT